MDASVPWVCLSQILGRCFSYAGKIYLADNFGIRLIPDDHTYKTLFQGNTSSLTFLDRPGPGNPSPQNTPDYRNFMLAPSAPALSSGALLVKGFNAPEVYLVDQGRRRQVFSQAVMDQFHFPPPDQRIPDIVVGLLPWGGYLWFQVTPPDYINQRMGPPMYQVLGVPAPPMPS
jgi:hypothetical protein